MRNKSPCQIGEISNAIVTRFALDGHLLIGWDEYDPDIGERIQWLVKPLPLESTEDRDWLFKKLRTVCMVYRVLAKIGGHRKFSSLSEDAKAALDVRKRAEKLSPVEIRESIYRVTRDLILFEQFKLDVFKTKTKDLASELVLELDRVFVGLGIKKRWGVIAEILVITFDLDESQRCKRSYGGEWARKIFNRANSRRLNMSDRQKPRRRKCEIVICNGVARIILWGGWVIAEIEIGKSTARRAALSVNIQAAAARQLPTAPLRSIGG